MNDSKQNDFRMKIMMKCWRNDGFCNRGNLPGAYIVGNSLYYQDYEWYKALEDDELKEEALRNKAIMEGFVNEEDDDESLDEREELCEIHELPVCNIRRFEMIKYSFGQDDEYVAVKEDEYDDLARTSDDACRAYQEIFRTMDKGWMDLVKEISMNIGGEFTNLEILKCWSLETSRRLFNTQSCSINLHGESTEQISGEFLILILFNSRI
ncbi:hypothetical protein Tco_0102708 [Tanacetum coccineum]